MPKIAERIPFVDPVIASTYAAEQRKAGRIVKLSLHKRAHSIVTIYQQRLGGKTK